MGGEEVRKRTDAGREAVERRGGGSTSDAVEVDKLRKDGSWRAEAEGRGGRGRKAGTSSEQGTRGEEESLEGRLALPAVERVCKSMEPVGWCGRGS